MQPPNWHRTLGDEPEPDERDEPGWTQWADDARTPRLVRPYVSVTSQSDDATTEFAAAKEQVAHDVDPPALPDDRYDWPADEPDRAGASRWGWIVATRARWVTVAVLATLAVAAVLRLVVVPPADDPVDPSRLAEPSMPIIIVDPSISPVPVPSASSAPPSVSPRTPPASPANAPQNPTGTTRPADAPATVTTAPTTGPATPRTVAIAGSGGRCLDNGYGRQVDQNPVGIYQCNGSGAQQWTINTNGTISNGSFCLQISFAYLADRGLTQLGTCNGGQNQQWRARPDSTLLHTSTGRCLYDATANGNGVMNPYTGTYWGEVTACNGDAGQRWST
jgi:hypothetical protein